MLQMVAPVPEQMTKRFLQLPELQAKRETSILVSYSLPWPDISLLDFLAQAADAPRVYWASENGPVEFAGYDLAATLVAAGPERFEAIEQQAAQLFEQVIRLNKAAPAAAGPRLFGGFSFEAKADAQPFWSAFPAARFMLPRYQLSRIGGENWLTLNQRLEPADDPFDLIRLINQDIQKLYLAARLRPKDQAGLAERQPLTEVKDLMAPERWNRLISGVTGRIRRGELEKVVLARARRLRKAGAVDVTTILARLERNYPGCYRFLFEPVPGHAFYGATPELLAHVSGSTLRTAALAGSIRRGQTPEEDERLGQQLLANPKERHEHALVVEAIRENLQERVSDLYIAPEPGIYRLSNIQHLQTAIKAKLPAGSGILPLIKTLHPTPALGGRPRALALPLISQAEPVSRGWYGAPIGWLDAEANGMFAVAIRSAISVGSDTLLYAGAGIVADSIPEREWQETELKFRPLMDALAGAQRP